MAPTTASHPPELGLLGAFRIRLQELLDSLDSSPSPNTQLAAALQDLQVAVEEIEVADEEITVQNEELLAVRGALESERQRYQELFEFAERHAAILRGIVLNPVVEPVEKG